ncbi:MAG TPA: ubiquinol-cytochrome c reductase iron-sulfur subunit [Ignavibacteria bacterium]|jgi:cytochrome b6-f complex iron-sulfur subunit
MPDKISRRDFIKRSAVGVVLGSAAISGLNLRVFSASAPKKAVVHKSGEDIVVKLADNPALASVGGTLSVTDDIMLIRMDESRFLAVSTICRHKGCTVELEGDKFVCPCHGSEYTKEGKVTQGPAKADLKTFETMFDAPTGTITIKMSTTEKKTEDTK